MRQREVGFGDMGLDFEPIVDQRPDEQRQTESNGGGAEGGTGVKRRSNVFFSKIARKMMRKKEGV